MTSKTPTLGLVVAALLMAGGEANAASADAILQSNLGPGNTYGGNGAYNINIFSARATPFTPSGNFTLTQIDVGIAQLEWNRHA
jgi:hypothetical protein